MAIGLWRFLGIFFVFLFALAGRAPLSCAPRKWRKKRPGVYDSLPIVFPCPGNAVHINPPVPPMPRIRRKEVKIQPATRRIWKSPLPTLNAHRLMKGKKGSGENDLYSDRSRLSVAYGFIFPSGFSRGSFDRTKDPRPPGKGKNKKTKNKPNGQHG